jgi:hypothetical protein
MEMSFDLYFSAPSSSWWWPFTMAPLGDLMLTASPAAGTDREIAIRDWRAASWVNSLGDAGEAIKQTKAGSPPLPCSAATRDGARSWGDDETGVFPFTPKRRGEILEKWVLHLISLFLGWLVAHISALLRK